MNEKNIKIANVIFIIIFAILLIIPSLKINMSDKSREENRYLEKFPSLFNHYGQLNTKLGTQFDKFYSDRFNLRYKLISFHKLFSCGINIYYCIGKDSVFDKKNHVIYKYTFFGMTSVQKKTPYDTKLIVNNIIQLNEYCKEKNIKLYFLIVPRQSDFVKYNVPNRMYKNIPDSAIKIINRLIKTTDVKIIYPYKEMMETNKETPVYFKTDHHWTKKGAYIGYKNLLQVISRDFPGIKIIKENELRQSTNKMVKATPKSSFNSGAMARNESFPEFYMKRILDTDYIYYQYIKLRDLKTEKKSNLPGFNSRTDIIYKYADGYDKKALLIGDSFTGNLSDFLPFSFKELLSLSDNYRHMNFNEYKDIIETYKPDIIIICMRTASLPVFLNLKIPRGEK